jgi:long-subunit fatty acid transport protein
MKIIHSLFIAKFCVISLTVFAQNEQDALRYSQPFINGTARFNSMCGAFTALGGDISTINQNPAGLSVFRRNELSIGLNLFNQTTTSLYLNSTNTNNQINLNIPHFGFLFYNKIEDSDYGWVSNYFAFSVNKSNYFHNKILIEGDNTKNSLTTYLVDKYSAGNGTSINNLDGFIAGPLFNVYVLDTLPGTYNKYRSPFYKGGIKQGQSIDLSGHINETSFSFGGNYKDKLLLGGAFSINSIRFSRKSNYFENDTKDTIKYLKSFNINENLNTRGYGLNIKMGFIYKPTDWMRIGASVISPTIYTLTDNYSTNVIAVWDSVGELSSKTKGAPFEYQISTPLRANIGIAFVINKLGLISADYEFLNYTQSRINSNSYNFSSENNAISNKYTSAQNIRLGGEIRLDPFAIRAGMGLYGSPYNTQFNTDATRLFYSGGVGYREDNFFMDLSVLLMKQNEFYYLYSSKYVNEAQNLYKITSITFTIGFKF